MSRDSLCLLQSSCAEAHHFEGNVCTCTKGKLYGRLALNPLGLAPLRHIACGEDVHRRLGFDRLHQLLLHIAQCSRRFNELRPIVDGI